MNCRKTELLKQCIDQFEQIEFLGSPERLSSTESLIHSIQLEISDYAKSQL